MQTKKTGMFATTKQLEEVSVAFNLDFNTPAMATLPGGKVPQAKEDFRGMANRFAIDAGLPVGIYGINPETREFIEITED